MSIFGSDNGENEWVKLICLGFGVFIIVGSIGNSGGIISLLTVIGMMGIGFFILGPNFAKRNNENDKSPTFGFMIGAISPAMLFIPAVLYYIYSKLTFGKEEKSVSTESV